MHGITQENILMLLFWIGIQLIKIEIIGIHLNLNINFDLGIMSSNHRAMFFSFGSN